MCCTKPHGLYTSRSCQILLLGFVLPYVVLTVYAQPQRAERGNEELPQIQLPADGPGLVEFLRRLSSADLPTERIEQLIAQLGSPRFTERERASRELVAVGISALPYLKRALRSSDGEVVRRAQACIREITPAEAVHGLPLEAVRGLVQLRPPGAIDALLRYLPYATNDESLEEEIWYGLDSLTRDEGKIDGALLAALKSEVPVKRAAAACIVGHRGSAEQRAEVRKLLGDAGPWVRLRAAQGLLAAQDKSGIPVLMALLEQPPVSLAWQAEELLHWLAVEDAPEGTIGSGSVKRRAACREAWDTWWREHESRIDFAEVFEDGRRPLLLLMHPAVIGTGKRVWLCGCDGKCRWELDNLPDVRDLHFLRGDRMLVAQGQSPRAVRKPIPHIEVSPLIGVTERDLNGTILWRYVGRSEPFACRRLPNGNTRIFSDGLEEVNPQGKRLLHRAFLRRGDSPYPAFPYLLSDGNVFFRQDAEEDLAAIAEMDPLTEKMKPLPLAPHTGRIAEIEPQPNGHCFVILPRTERVFDVDQRGQITWEYSISGENGTRHRNGDTLICASVAFGNRLVVIAPAGKMVREIFLGEGVPPRCQLCFALLGLGFDAPYPIDLDRATSLRSRLKDLRSKDVNRRRLSVCALVSMDPQGTAIVPALIECLDDAQEVVRSDAHQALERVTNPHALPIILQAARNSRFRIRAAAMSLLGKFHGQVQGIPAILLNGLKDNNPLVRREAASAAWQFEPEDPAIVQALVKALQDKGLPDGDNQRNVAQTAAYSLGCLGKKALPAVPALIKASEASEVATASDAIWALGHLAVTDASLAKKVMPVLVAQLSNHKPTAIRAIAAGTLGLLGPQAQSAVPHLLQALVPDADDVAATRPDFRADILSALGQIGPGAESAVPELVKVLQNKNEDPSVRKLAAGALGQIGSSAPLTIRALEEAMEDPAFGIRAAAKAALKKTRR